MIPEPNGVEQYLVRGVNSHGGSELSYVHKGQETRLAWS